MDISEILTLKNTSSHAYSESKKSVLELISKLAAANIRTLNTPKVFEKLVARERLGSTAVGNGIAIPHAKVEGISKPIATLVQLTKPIEFDAPDEKPVDILFGLIMPTDNPEQHLKTLSALTERLRNPLYRDSLRNAKNREELFKIAIGKTE